MGDEPSIAPTKFITGYEDGRWSGGGNQAEVFSSSLLDNCFELALGVNLYPLKVEVLISDTESDFCDT